MFDIIVFENAMFSGINGILNYYEPYIRGSVVKKADKCRAPLNEDDLTQECKLAVVRCWHLHCEDLEIKNFDLLVKRAIANCLITAIGREFCQKRGRCKIEFFSDLSYSHSNDSGDKVDFETILFQSNQQSYNTNQSGLDTLVHHLNLHLVAPVLKTTFNHIVDHYAFEDLRPNRISVCKKKKIAKELNLEEVDIANHLEQINFIFQGYRENFCSPSFI
jgi:hypothetical protein